MSRLIVRGRRGLVALLLICVAWPAWLSAQEAPLVMGVFPRKGFTRTIESFTPLSDYLSRQLGRKIILSSGRTFAEFWHGVEQRQYDIVHFNQYHYVRAHRDFQYTVIGKNEENNQATMSGVLVVRKDSGIENAADLRGKRIIFGGGRDAMQSYIIASYLLQKAGLNESSYEKVFAESPANAIYAVFYRQALAAGSADANLELPIVKKRIDTSQLKIIAQSEKLPHLPWAVKNEMPKTLKEKIKMILTDMSKSQEGKKILKDASLTAVHAAEDHDYDAHREIIKLVLGEEY